MYLLNYFTICCEKSISQLCVSLDYFNSDITVLLFHVPVHVWHFFNLKKHRSYLKQQLSEFHFHY